MAKNGDPRKTGKWQGLRRDILAFDDTCGICGGVGADTVDHIMPIALGGDPFDRENLRPAHAGCNYARGDGTGRRRRAERAHTSGPAQDYGGPNVSTLGEYKRWAAERGFVLIRSSGIPLGAMHVSFAWNGEETL